MFYLEWGEVQASLVVYQFPGYTVGSEIMSHAHDNREKLFVFMS